VYMQVGLLWTILDRFTIFTLE